MTKKSPAIVFFGNERLATGVSATGEVFQSLISAGYDVRALVINEHAQQSRTQRKVEVAIIASDNNIPILSPEKVGIIERNLNKLNPAIGILVAYGQIIPQKVIDVFPNGIINIHPSLLPHHRGSTPIESVILKGETTSGVSLMQLTARMDAGPVYAQRTLSVPSDISKQDLSEMMILNGKELLLSCLPGIINNELKPKKQDESEATYDGLIRKSDAIINWNLPATIIEQQIRAYQGWPKSRTKIGDHEIIINKAVVAETSGKAGEFAIRDKKLIIFCSKNALSLQIVQPLSKKEMPIEAFLAGYKL